MRPPPPIGGADGKGKRRRRPRLQASPHRAFPVSLPLASFCPSIFLSAQAGRLWIAMRERPVMHDTQRRPARLLEPRRRAPPSSRRHFPKQDPRQSRDRARSRRCVGLGVAGPVARVAPTFGPPRLSAPTAAPVALEHELRPLRIEHAASVGVALQEGARNRRTEDVKGRVAGVRIPEPVIGGDRSRASELHERDERPRIVGRVPDLLHRDVDPLRHLAVVPELRHRALTIHVGEHATA